MSNKIDSLVPALKALADPMRLRLVALCTHGECSVSELTAVVGLSQPRVSQHLRQLCDAGLLERFRDGQFVYYRIASAEGGAGLRRRLLALLPADEPLLEKDASKLRDLRPAPGKSGGSREHDRRLHRALVELSLVAPLGDLIDIGSGRGRLLKLLASRAQRAVGVDVDADARRLARAELLLAGLPNCTLRQGDMYDLPFDDSNFDTVILDDVLVDAERPAAVLTEATRLLRPQGRLIVLTRVSGEGSDALVRRLANWCQETRLMLAPPRAIPGRSPHWLVAVAKHSAPTSAAA